MRAVNERLISALVAAGLLVYTSAIVLAAPYVVTYKDAWFVKFADAWSAGFMDSVMRVMPVMQTFALVAVVLLMVSGIALRMLGVHSSEEKP